MLVSYNWLQQYFDKELPNPEEMARLFTMHALEIETLEKKGDDTIIDFKVTPNRAHDCLSFDGIAREFSVLSGIPLKKVESGELKVEDTKHSLSITVEDSKKCPRYAGRIIENVFVGPSPSWLKERLEAIGQRSVNNIVDVTNYVMFATGQPLHAFDLNKLARSGNEVEIIVRSAKDGEKLETLDGKNVELDESVNLITDALGPLAMAGIKGGKRAEVDAETVNIVLESANFDPVTTRKASVKTGVKTESSKRFENGIAPELAEKGMEVATAILSQFASTDNTKIGEIADTYPRVRNPYKIGVSAGEVNKLLGTNLSFEETENLIKRLGFKYEVVENPIAHVVEMAQKYVGVPYKLGASISYDAPDFFDCSSLTAFLYSQAGVQIPRVSVDQYVFGDSISEENAVPGDLIFANTGENHIWFETKEFLNGLKVPEGVDHVGIYIGNGEVIHANGTSKSVAREEINGSSRFKNIVGFRRMTEIGEPKFVVTVPMERLDLIAARSFYVSGNTADLIEEIGRLYGYENLKGIVPKDKQKPEINKKLHYASIVRNILVKKDFSEVYTYSLVDKGDIELENPMADDKKFLRENLAGSLNESLEINFKNAPLLGLSEIKIFEIGNVFCRKDGEYTSCAIGVKTGKKGNATELIIEEAKKALEEALGTGISGDTEGGVFEFNFDSVVASLPEPSEYIFPDMHEKGVMFSSISQYPFALRDIAVFVPEDIPEDEVRKTIEQNGGNLMVRMDLFDVFKKGLPAQAGGKISYAFHLVFQSHEKTLDDKELDEIMSKITEKLNSKTGWQVR